MKSRGDSLFLLLMLLAMTSWGGSWTSAKLIATDQPPEVLVFWRFLVTVVSFLPVLAWYRAPLKIDRFGLRMTLVGAALIVAYNLMFFRGLQTGLAGAGGVLVTTLNPILTFVVTLVAFRRRVGGREILGLTLGLTGGMILLRAWQLSADTLLLSGNAFFLLASFSWVFLTITSEKAKAHLSPLVFSFYVNLFSTLLIFPVALPRGLSRALEEGWVFWLNIGYMAVFATTFATTVYFFASARLGARKAASFIFLVPTSAVGIAWLVLGETPMWNTIVGGAVAVAAVYLINLRPRDKVAATEAVAPLGVGGKR
ncbi:MAG: DMT family transporter [Candidatus Zixiibacteriota bacterium]|nr:MAG: DMT family transporter [candidate division Zixibacteria bacterium]